MASAMECNSGTMEANFSMVPGMCEFLLCRCAKSASCDRSTRDSDMSAPAILLAQTRSSTSTELAARVYQISHQVMASNRPIDSSRSKIRARALPESVHESAMAVRAAFDESLPSLEKIEARASSAARHRTMTV
jgi:hypothetical protein